MKWIKKLLYAIFGFIFGIFIAPITFVVLTLGLLLMLVGLAFCCLFLPFGMAIAWADEG